MRLSYYAQHLAAEVITATTEDLNATIAELHKLTDAQHWLERNHPKRIALMRVRHVLEMERREREAVARHALTGE